MNVCAIELIDSVYYSDHCSNSTVLAHTPQGQNRLSAVARLVGMVYFPSVWQDGEGRWFHRLLPIKMGIFFFLCKLDCHVFSLQ